MGEGFNVQSCCIIIAFKLIISTIHTFLASLGGNSEARFGIVPSTGELYLTLALDYETTTSYSLTVEATDGGSPAQSVNSAIPITVTGTNDNTPTCPTSTYTYSVIETAASGVGFVLDIPDLHKTA